MSRRKSMSVTLSADASSFLAAVIKEWPRLKYGAMSHIGYFGRKALEHNYLEGQVITLRAKPYDSRGYRTVSYRLKKWGSEIKIASYPLNLYKPREVYASATAVVLSEAERAMREYDKNTLQADIEKLDLKYNPKRWRERRDS